MLPANGAGQSECRSLHTRQQLFAGIAAVLYTMDPTMPAHTVKQIIMLTVDPRDVETAAGALAAFPNCRSCILSLPDPACTAWPAIVNLSHCQTALRAPA